MNALFAFAYTVVRSKWTSSCQKFIEIGLKKMKMAIFGVIFAKKVEVFQNWAPPPLLRVPPLMSPPSLVTRKVSPPPLKQKFQKMSLPPFTTVWWRTM